MELRASSGFPPQDRLTRYTKFIFVCSPYRYGYVTELRASKGFRYDNVKHYTMGRIAHEMGCSF